MEVQGPSPALSRLATSMVQPKPCVTIAELHQLWQHDDIELVCLRPPHLEDIPDLAQRFRGALGNALERLCLFAPRRPDPFDRESAYELLFEWPNPKVRVGKIQREIAVPMMILADMQGNLLRFVIRLFGCAAIHLPIVRAAAELAASGGLSLRKGAHRVPLRVQAIRWHRYDGAAATAAEANPAMAASSALLRFLSPVIIRSGSNLPGDEGRSGRLIRLEPWAIPRSAVLRLCALAPWMGFNLDVDIESMAEQARQLDYKVEIFAAKWVRHSMRNKGKAIPVEAYGGCIRIAAGLQPLLAYLRLAEQCGIGGGCASGFGRYELVVYP